MHPSRFKVACVVTALVAFCSWLAQSLAVDPEHEPDSASHPTVYALEEGVEFRRVIVGAVAEGQVSGDQEKLIYSNTLGLNKISLAANFLYSDDITVINPNGCELKRFRFKVLGKVSTAGIGGNFTVKYALYSNCPSAAGSNAAQQDLVKIPGTSGEIFFPDDGPREIEHVIAPPNNVALPTNFYFGLQFNRANCGTVIGAPATIGFSADGWNHPSFSCNEAIGGYPQYPHASFWAEFFGDESCAESHPGYRNLKAAGQGTRIATPGANVWVVDDFDLVTDKCLMRAYEVAVKGDGLYSFELRETCDGPTIAGTEKQYLFQSAPPNVQIARFDLDEPILLPQEVWLAVRSSSDTSGGVLTGAGPQLGSAGEDFEYYYLIEASTCAPIYTHQGFFGSFHASITCEGLPPSGACCDLYRPEPSGAVYCRDLPEMNCPAAPQDHWLEGMRCADRPFPHRCGEGACCVTDQGCENLTQFECNAREPLNYTRSWLPDKTCEEENPTCSAGDCSVHHSTPGCADHDCEPRVCSLDWWCCEVEWDSACTVLTANHCFGGPRNTSCMSQNGLAPHQTALQVASNSTTLVNSRYIGSGAGPFCPFEEPLSGGGLWFRFTATEDSAHVSTCNSLYPIDVRYLKVSQAMDNTSLERQCATLSFLGCIYDGTTCAGGKNSDMCIFNLVPGQTYFVQIGIPYGDPSGLVRLDIESPCPSNQGLESIPNAELTMDSANRFERADQEYAASEVGVEAGVSKPAIHESASPMPGPAPAGAVAHRGPYLRDGFMSVQVNVDALGNNIVGDAGNEPSIAVDPTNPQRMAIGWRQFNNPQTDRQAGWAYSHDGGVTWTFPGVIDPGTIRTDPVLESDAEGVFYYHSYSIGGGHGVNVFRSFNGGVSWDSGLVFGGGDKPWIAIDKTPGIGRGNLYSLATFEPFRRGIPPDFVPPTVTELEGAPFWGTIDIAPDGAVWIAGEQSSGFRVVRSPNAYRQSPLITFDRAQYVDVYPKLEGSTAGPNPGGLSGQYWIATNPLGSPSQNHVYVLLGGITVFARSRDAGLNWDPPVRVYDYDAAHHWFGTMSVAPSGRIDVIWNDTRDTLNSSFSELFYSYSEDGGETWSVNVPVSLAFRTTDFWPRKLGDYYDMVSDGKGAHVAYAATFNGEHDVYYLRLLPPVDCNKNQVYDPDETAANPLIDTNHDDVPDECQSDFDGDGLIDDVDPDIDADGVANGVDYCLFSRPGEPVTASGAIRLDADGNCSIDLNDLWRFQNCVAGGIGYVSAPADACLTAFDRDQSQTIDLRDFAAFQNAIEP